VSFRARPEIEGHTSILAARSKDEAPALGKPDSIIIIIAI